MSSFSNEVKVILLISLTTVIEFFAKVALTKSNTFFKVFLISKSAEILS